MSDIEAKEQGGTLRALLLDVSRSTLRLAMAALGNCAAECHDERGCVSCATLADLAEALVGAANRAVEFHNPKEEKTT